MDVINGRPTALASAIAAAVLSGVLVHESARADTYAFGNTEFPQDYAQLIVEEGASRSL